MPTLWVLVDWEWRAQSDFGYLQARWRAPRNHHQRYKILRERDLLWWEEEPRAGRWLLGPLCWLQGGRFREDDDSEAMRSENGGVESVLRQFPERDEEHVHRGAQEVRTESPWPETDSPGPRQGPVHNQSSFPDVTSELPEAEDGPVQTLVIWWYHRRLWEFAVRSVWMYCPTYCTLIYLANLTIRLPNITVF